MSKLIEGFWKCDKCGREKIKSRYDSCPGCGSRRNSTTEYEMLDSSNYVPEDIAKIIDRGPDWLCSYCNCLNRANYNSCNSCGAPKNTSVKNYFQNKKERREKQLNQKKLDDYYNNINSNNEKSDSYSISSNSSKNDKNNENDENKKNSSNFNARFEYIRTIGWSVLGVITFAAIVILLFFLFKPKIENIDVTGFSWKSSISIEEYKTVEESDWYLPSSARLQYTQQEISHYEEVFDHFETRTKKVPKEVIVGYKDKVEYIDLGNGYFEENVYSVPIYDTIFEEEEYQEAIYRNEPVYATKYYYEIDKWVYKETIYKTGNDKQPYYPELNLSSNERESSRSQIYFVSGKNEDGENITVSVAYDDWIQIDINQTVKFEISFGNFAKMISSED